MRQGTRRDAILFSVGANASHGLRRTNQDKRRAVETLLRDEEWGAWSNSEIARRCGVHHSTVADLRPSLSVSASEPRTYTTKHGTIATMNTAAIGKRPAAPDHDPLAGFNDAGEPIVRRDVLVSLLAAPLSHRLPRQKKREGGHYRIMPKRPVIQSLVNSVFWRPSDMSIATSACFIRASAWFCES